MKPLDKLCLKWFQNRWFYHRPTFIAASNFVVATTKEIESTQTMDEVHSRQNRPREKGIRSVDNIEAIPTCATLNGLSMNELQKEPWEDRILISHWNGEIQHQTPRRIWSKGPTCGHSWWIHTPIQRNIFKPSPNMRAVDVSPWQMHMQMSPDRQDRLPSNSTTHPSKLRHWTWASWWY